MVSGIYRHLKCTVLYVHLFREGMCVGEYLYAHYLREQQSSSCVFISEALVDILLTVVKLSPSLCESSHLAVLLGAYGATLSAVGKCVSLGKVLPTRPGFHLHR